MDGIQVRAGSGVIKPKSTTAVDEWLEIATRGLCESSQNRIREEVSAHYLDALSDARGRNVSERDALDDALLSLGHPNIARRQFRKVYLTAAEARRLERGTGGEGRWRGYAVSIFLLPGCVLFATLLLWSMVAPEVSVSSTAGSVLAACGVGMLLMANRMYAWWRWLRRQDAMTRMWYRAYHETLFGIGCVALVTADVLRALTVSAFRGDSSIQWQPMLEGLFLFATFRESPDAWLTTLAELSIALEKPFHFVVFGYLLFNGIVGLRTHAKLNRIQPGNWPTTPVA